MNSKMNTSKRSSLSDDEYSPPHRPFKRFCQEESDDEDSDVGMPAKDDLASDSEDEDEDKSSEESLEDVTTNNDFYSVKTVDVNETMFDQMMPESNFEYGPKYSKQAVEIMKKLGHKEGTGLGKHQQGRVNIIETSKQRGRRGLGLPTPEIYKDGPQFDPEKEIIVNDEQLKWLEGDCIIPDFQTMMTWPIEGNKKNRIDDETKFCEPSLIAKLLNAKNALETMSPEEMMRARNRCNPYELVKAGIFLNRAAMKMANIDMVTGFMFSSIEPEHKDLLYFADICSGPGGFSEYILWRKKWHAKGFGMTLKGDCDFKLEDFQAGSCETFEPFYGEAGDGDIYKEENIKLFQKLIMESTSGAGVDFVMADGGFPYKEQANIQEILSKQIYLCQMLCAISILKKGGHLLCKVFDNFTPFSVGLIYLMYCAFEKISIFKPVTSRPANSERYLLGYSMKPGTEDIRDYLFIVNQQLNQLASVQSSTDVLEIVPDEFLKEKVFYDYIYERNNILGTHQVNSLLKIVAFHNDPKMVEETQHDLRRNLLKKWQVPDETRKRRERLMPHVHLQKLNIHVSLDSYKEANLILQVKDLIQLKKAAVKYRCLVLGTSETQASCTRTFYYGTGRRSVFKYEAKKWTKCDRISFELYPNTLVYGEMVAEFCSTGLSQKRVNAFHIIDAMLLGGENINDLPYERRCEEIEIYCKALSKLSQPTNSPIRLKESTPLENIDEIFSKLRLESVKGQSGARTVYCFEKDPKRFIIPTGMLIVNCFGDYITSRSKSTNMLYWYNTKTSKSEYERPLEARVNFMDTLTKEMFFWWWKEGVKIMDHHDADKESIHKHTLLGLLRH